MNRPFNQKWNAEDYAKNSSAQLHWAQELIEKLALSGSESILDVGCGDGKISAQLAGAVTNGKVVGIDLSREMIRLATASFPTEYFPNLSFYQMDASKIYFDERFDVAFSNAALHWVEDHLAVLRGVRSSLKSGGKILLQMGGRGNAVDIFDAIETIKSDARWATYLLGYTPPYYFYGPDDYESWLHQSGFRVKRVELIPKDMQHTGAEGLSGWLRTTWFPFTDRLPRELRETFISELVSAYTKKFPIDEHGNTHVRMVRLEVEAVAIG